jgi:hypothetical protein
VTHLSVVRALLRAPLGPELRTSRGCGQAAACCSKARGAPAGGCRCGIPTEQWLGAHAEHLNSVLARGFSVEVHTM